MATRSFFIQSPEDARRHMNLLASGLKKVALAGAVGGAGCTALAVFLTNVLIIRGTQANPAPGSQETSTITVVAWSLAIAMLLFSGLYYLSGWAIEKQKPWSRYAASGTFLLKILLCVWIGRGSVAAMIVFLLIATGDFYGLWVLLSKVTGSLFSSSPISSSDTTQAPAKPANLVT